MVSDDVAELHLTPDWAAWAAQPPTRAPKGRTPAKSLRGHLVSAPTTPQRVRPRSPGCISRLVDPFWQGDESRHDHRRCNIAQLVAKGVDVRIVMNRVGQSSAQVTLGYTLSRIEPLIKRRYAPSKT